MGEDAGSRCLWCHGEEGRLTAVRAPVTDRFGLTTRQEEVTVHHRHAAEAREHLEEVARNASSVVVGVALWSALTVGLTALVVSLEAGGGDADFWAGVLLGPWTAGLGALLIRYPYATPETVRWTGLRRSRQLVRGSGWLVVGLGVWILTWAIR